MAAVPLPRSDVYLSLLAAKALAALGDLTDDPCKWNDRIQMGLGSGIEYCDAYGSVLASRSEAGDDRRGFKRRATNSGEVLASGDPEPKCEKVKQLLIEMLSGKKAAADELDVAVEFFSAGC